MTLQPTANLVQEWEPPQTWRIDIEVSPEIFDTERYVMGLPCPSPMAFALIMLAVVTRGRPGDLAKMNEEWRPTARAKELLRLADRQAEWELAKKVCRTGDSLKDPASTIRELGFSIEYETQRDAIEIPCRRVTIHRPERAVYR